MKILNKYFNMFILFCVVVAFAFSFFLTIKYYNSIKMIFLSTKQPLFYEVSKTYIDTAPLESKMLSIDDVIDVNINVANTVVYLNISSSEKVITSESSILKSVEERLNSELKDGISKKHFIDIYVTDGSANVITGYYDYDKKVVVWK